MVSYIDLSGKQAIVPGGLTRTVPQRPPIPPAVQRRPATGVPCRWLEQIKTALPVVNRDDLLNQSEHGQSAERSSGAYANGIAVSPQDRDPHSASIPTPEAQNLFKGAAISHPNPSSPGGAQLGPTRRTCACLALTLMAFLHADANHQIFRQSKTQFGHERLDQEILARARSTLPLSRALVCDRFQAQNARA
jgi:hypothetical protein